MPFYIELTLANFVWGSLIWLEFFSLVNAFNGFIRQECQNFCGWFLYKVWGKQALWHGVFWFLQSILVPVLAFFVALPATRFEKTLILPGLILGIFLGIKTFILELRKRSPKIT